VKNLKHLHRGGRFRICDVMHVASLTLWQFRHRFVPTRSSYEQLETAIAALACQVLWEPVTVQRCQPLEKTDARSDTLTCDQWVVTFGRSSQPRPV